MKRRQKLISLNQKRNIYYWWRFLKNFFSLIYFQRIFIKKDKNIHFFPSDCDTFLGNLMKFSFSSLQYAENLNSLPGNLIWSHSFFGLFIKKWKIADKFFRLYQCWNPTAVLIKCWHLLLELWMLCFCFCCKKYKFVVYVTWKKRYIYTF